MLLKYLSLQLETGLQVRFLVNLADFINEAFSIFYEI